MLHEKRKSNGSYFTPDVVVRSLISWAIRRTSDQLLDPSCGDGRFLAEHENSTGVERDRIALHAASKRAPRARLHESDFFAWAAEAQDRYDYAVGNPPFIRFQRFNGVTRRNALALCARQNAAFPGLTSSWAPFLVVAASLLRPGGRIAFVVPAEIGHAPYARPVLEFLTSRFHRIQIVAVQHKLFPELSEDCWLLFADGFGEPSNEILLTPMTGFGFMSDPPSLHVAVTVRELDRWGWRLRPFLLSRAVRDLYDSLSSRDNFVRFGQVANVGIGYVTGANDFFHLRPSQAAGHSIPDAFLQPTVRNGKFLRGKAVNASTVSAWLRNDEPALLLRLDKNTKLPACVTRYLAGSAADAAKSTYKCRNRDPWYAVPDVKIPSAFLTYMSGGVPMLVANRTNCACTNSVHAVRVKGGMSVRDMQAAWSQPLVTLSCEIEGHPLGGGLLKVEPGEASRVWLPTGGPMTRSELVVVRDGIETLRRWRHCG